MEEKINENPCVSVQSVSSVFHAEDDTRCFTLK